MFRKLSLISLFTLMPASYYYAQTTVYAYVKDAQGNPIERADVDLLQSDDVVVADKIGYFQFVNLKPGTYQLVVSKTGFEPRTLNFTVSSDEKRKDLGVVNLLTTGGSANAGIIIIDESQSDDEGGSMQPTVGLLSSGRDAFQNTAAFELGAYWFRPRGVDNRYEDVLFNGVPMSKSDNGRVEFSNWGGLNDVTRYALENAENISPSEYAFGNLGGVVYYGTRASSYRKGTSLTYSATNRSYNNRLMATYSSGVLKNGWAFTVSGSRRWAENGKLDGTYQDNYAYFASIEKQFGSRFAVNLTAFGSPTYRANNSPNTQEVYDLMGKNYNSYWGWQDGEKRNSRIRKMFEPMFQLAFYNKIGKNSNWNNTFSYQFGSDSRSRLERFLAPNAEPTYYRYLPSYGNYTTQDWLNNSHISQINWAGLYSYNYGIESSSNFQGISYGNGVVGRRAAYSLMADVNKDKTFNYVSHFDTQINDRWKLNLNFHYQKLKSDNFRRVEDLLGADFALNLDPFRNSRQYNLDDDNIIARKGDRIQYSYNLFRDTYAFNASTEVDFPKWRFIASVFGSYISSQREGMYRHHFFRENSLGKSTLNESFTAGMKGQVTYKINGKNFIVYNGAFFSLAPTLNEIFINPRFSDLTTPNLRNQIVNSNDLSYILRAQTLKLRLTGYWTEINNATDITRYFAEGIQLGSSNDAQDVLLAEILSGVSKRYRGLEMGADVKILPTLSVVAVASLGEYTYRNNPDVYLNTDSDLYAVGTEHLGKANIKDYKIAGTPQKAFSLGLRYNSPKYWWVGVSANYLMDQYLNFSSLLRTSNFYTDPLTGDNYTAISGYGNNKIDIPAATPENVAKLLKQKRFDDQFMLNANVGKSFLIGKYRMGISFSVNNILNNRDYVTGGYEQGRKSNFRDAFEESTRPNPYFGPRLWYDRGRTFFANVYFRF